jgi:hypothetical protein
LSKSTDLDPAALPAKPEDGPPFQAPWQARAFAVAVTMCQASYYTWDEFRVSLPETRSTPRPENWLILSKRHRCLSEAHRRLSEIFTRRS